MLSTKNLSPRQLSAFTAGILSVPIAFGIYIITGNWRIGLGSLLFVFAGGYGLILFTLEKFIYRKIKLIYKMIYQTKATKKEEMYFKYLLPRKSIDEVRADVEAWGERRNQEIELQAGVRPDGVADVANRQIREHEERQWRDQLVQSDAGRRRGTADPAHEGRCAGL